MKETQDTLPGLAEIQERDKRKAFIDEILSGPGMEKHRAAFLALDETSPAWLGETYREIIEYSTAALLDWIFDGQSWADFNKLRIPPVRNNQDSHSEYLSFEVNLDAETLTLKEPHSGMIESELQTTSFVPDIPQNAAEAAERHLRRALCLFHLSTVFIDRRGGKLESKTFVDFSFPVNGSETPKELQEYDRTGHLMTTLEDLREYKRAGAFPPPEHREKITEKTRDLWLKTIGPGGYEITTALIDQSGNREAVEGSFHRRPGARNHVCFGVSMMRDFNACAVDGKSAPNIELRADVELTFLPVQIPKDLGAPRADGIARAAYFPIVARLSIDRTAIPEDRAAQDSFWAELYESLMNEARAYTGGPAGEVLPLVKMESRKAIAPKRITDKTDLARINHTEKTLARIGRIERQRPSIESGRGMNLVRASLAIEQQKDGLLTAWHAQENAYYGELFEWAGIRAENTPILNEQGFIGIDTDTAGKEVIQALHAIIDRRDIDRFRPKDETRFTFGNRAPIYSVTPAQLKKIGRVKYGKTKRGKHEFDKDHERAFMQSFYRLATRPIVFAERQTYKDPKTGEDRRKIITHPDFLFSVHLVHEDRITKLDGLDLEGRALPTLEHILIQLNPLFFDRKTGGRYIERPPELYENIRTVARKPRKQVTTFFDLVFRMGQGRYREALKKGEDVSALTLDGFTIDFLTDALRLWKEKASGWGTRIRDICEQAAEIAAATPLGKTRGMIAAWDFESGFVRLNPDFFAEVEARKLGTGLKAARKIRERTDFHADGANQNPRATDSLANWRQPCDRFNELLEGILESPLFENRPRTLTAKDISAFKEAFRFIIREHEAARVDGGPIPLTFRHMQELTMRAVSFACGKDGKHTPTIAPARYYLKAVQSRFRDADFIHEQARAFQRDLIPGKSHGYLVSIFSGTRELAAFLGERITAPEPS